MKNKLVTHWKRNRYYYKRCFNRIRSGIFYRAFALIIRLFRPGKWSLAADLEAYWSDIDPWDSIGFMKELDDMGLPENKKGLQCYVAATLILSPDTLREELQADIDGFDDEEIVERAQKLLERFSKGKKRS